MLLLVSSHPRPSESLSNKHTFILYTSLFIPNEQSWITLEQGKTTADAMGDVWRGLEVVEAATRVGSEMLVS